jgi:hypothetical protein
MKTNRAYIPELLELSRDSDSRMRRKALHALCPCTLKSHQPEVWHRFLEMADDPDAAVRRGVVHVLCDGSPLRYRPEVLQVLEARYNDSDHRVRKSVRRVLATYRRSGAINVL